MPLVVECDIQTDGVQSTFSWRARDEAGAVRAGTMSATSQNDVAQRLRAEGMYVIAIRESAAGASDIVVTESRERKLSRDNAIAFFRQLSVMLEAGVPISEALDAIVQQFAGDDSVRIYERIQNEVESGEPLSMALARHPKSFSLAIISLIRAAEATGSLDRMAKRAAEHLEKERRVVQQVRTALTYPSFMGGAGGLIIIALLLFVLPRFAAIYASREAILPAPTRMLLASAGFLRESWWWYVPLLLTVGVIGMFVMRTAGAKQRLEYVLLRLPVVRSVMLAAMLSRWTRTLSILCASGINLIDAVSIVRSASRSPSQHELWDDVESSIRDGRSLSGVLSDSSLVPPSVAAMISAGERSGRLPEVLATVADCCEEGLEATVKRTTSLIEPALIVGLGLVVGLIALAMLLPVFGMSRVVSG